MQTLKRGLTLFAAVLMMIVPYAAFALEQGPALDAEIDKILKNNKAKGAAMVVAKDGEIVYEHYYGIADRKEKTPVSENTYFRLASTSKLVSAIHVMQLVERGKLDLDTDISEYLGYEVKNPYHEDVPITTRMLMTHTSSVNSNGGYTRDSNGLRSLISAEKPKRGNWYDEVPGSEYRYSNFGAGILGSIIESVTDKNIDDTFRENVFGPLGITAAFAPCLLPDPENATDVFQPDGKLFESRRYAAEREWDGTVDPDMHFKLTIGAIWMRAKDLCRIGMLMLNGGTLDGVTLLEPETVQEMMSEQKGKGAVTADTPYGLCVYHEKTLVPGKTIYGHQGISHGILTAVYYDPETRFVYAFCCNGCKNNLDNRVAHLTRRLFPLVWNEYSEYIGTQNRAADDTVPQSAETVKHTRILTDDESN